MSIAESKFIVARWFAGDLTDYRSAHPLRVLSVHRQVINLAVNGWPHLLTLSSPALYKGPAAICLEEEDFFACKDQINRLATGRFQPGNLTFSEKRHSLTIDWTNSPPCSFAPPLLPGFNPLIINRSLELLLSRISREKNPSASAALLEIEGGESYFRDALMSSFPLLLDSLLAGGQRGQEQFATNCRRLCGLGKGSTPTGDDLIHGALIACRYYFLSRRFPWVPPNYPPGLYSATTLLGGHMLEMGIRGLAVAPVKNLLSEIFSGTLNTGSINRVLEIGSSTGYDLAAAIWCTLRYLAGIGQFFQLK